jgi:hypothetical protein
MQRSHARRRLLSPVLLVAVVLAAYVPVALAGTTSKPYLADLDSGTTNNIPPATNDPNGNTDSAVSPLSSAAYAATFINESSPQSLGSLDLRPPKDPGSGTYLFTVPDSQTITPTVTAADGTPLANGTGYASANVVHVRDLNAPPGASVAFTFTAVAPCSGGTYTWTATVKQANNFSGPPGNDLFQDGRSDLTTSVSGGGCKLMFRQETSASPLTYSTGQPANAQKSANITTAPGDPTGAPVKVEAEDGSGNVLTAFAGQVTLSLYVDPSGGTAQFCGSSCNTANTVTAAAVDGVATFSQLTINVSHTGYKLQASSPSVPSSGWVVSNAFGIFDMVCTTGQPCVVPGADEQATVDTSSTGKYFVSSGIENIDCGLPASESAPTTIVLDSTSTADKIVTLRISKKYVQATSNNGASFYEICYKSDTPFNPKGGDPTSTADDTTGPALLPDCSKTQGSPCVQSRTKNKSGDVLVTVILPAGDPWMH